MALFSKKKEAKQEEPKKAPVKVAQEKKKEKKQTEAKPSMKELYGNAEKTEKIKKITKDEHGKKVEVAVSKYNQAYRILIKPLITEKGGSLANLGKYVFEVAKDANKVEIAKAIQEVYGIMPVKVNLLRMAGKRKRRGNITGKRKNWKKAIVTLPKGKTINVYEGV